jgi:hypothetical protein
VYDFSEPTNTHRKILTTMLSIGESSVYISYLPKRRQTNVYLFMERFNLRIFTVSFGFEPENAIALLVINLEAFLLSLADFS